MSRLTIFTPTYNRAYTLPALFDSLCRQSSKDFEWLIVDDGSSDGTEEVVRRWMERPEGDFPIRYVKQPNGGKHRAINRAVLLAEGELFFIVDSDDFILPEAVHWILSWWDDVKTDDRYAGVCGLKCFPDKTPVGGTPSYVGYLDTDCLSFRTKYHERGDKAEIFRTTVLREFPFPEFEGERFVTEALVWNRIAQRYIMRYYNRNIYCCDYLADGLTRSIAKHHFASPRGTALYYAELAHWPQVDAWTRLKAILNYWRYSTGYPFRLATKCCQIGWSALFFLPLGLVFRLRDKWKL